MKALNHHASEPSPQLWIPSSTFCPPQEGALALRLQGRQGSNFPKSISHRNIIIYNIYIYTYVNVYSYIHILVYTYVNIYPSLSLSPHRHLEYIYIHVYIYIHTLYYIKRSNDFDDLGAPPS